jgi:O-antigen/teichoic acid export membrane protein
VRTDVTRDTGRQPGRNPRDLITVSRGAATSLLGTVLGTVTGLVVTMMLTRTLGAAGYGSIVLALSIAVLIESVGNVGLSNGSARMMAMARAEGDEARALRLLKASLLAGVATGAVGIAVMLGVAGSGVMGDGDASIVLAISAPLVVVTALRAAIYGALRAYRDLRSVLVLSVVVPITDVVVVGALVSIGVRDIRAYAAGFVVVACSELVIAAKLLSARRTIGRLLDTTRLDLRLLLAFSVPLVITQIFYFSIRSVDVLLLGLVRSPEAAGLYSPVMRLAESATKVLSAFPLLFVPIATAYVARQRTAELRDLYVSITKWAYLIGFPLILVMVVSPGPVLGMLFGERYEDLGTVARILALGYWVVLVTGLNGVTLSAIGAIKDMAIASAVGLGLTLGMGFVLVRLFGPEGAAATNTIAYTFANVAFSVLLFRRMRVTPFRTDSSKLFIYSGVVVLVAVLLVEVVVPDLAAWSLAVAFLASACWLVGGVFGKPFAMRWSEMRRVVSRTKSGPPEDDDDPVDPLAPAGVDVP